MPGRCGGCFLLQPGASAPACGRPPVDRPAAEQALQGASPQPAMKSLLQLEDLSKHYGARTIFGSVTAAFYEEQKIGVIGRNGAGKSTLARLITGEEAPDTGRIIRTRDLRLGYLEQQDPFRRDETILAFLERYTGCEEWRCGEAAARFQIRPEQLATPVGEISGGFQTRVKLAAMLLRDPNFLILDEPTNYLDLSTLLLLENFLRGFKGGYLIISHDREFLLRTCEQTLEVDRGELVLYPGDVEAYMAFKDEQASLAEKGNRVIDVKARQLQEFIDRNRARAATATRAQSKMKELERLTRGRIAVAHAERNARIRIPSVEPRSGRAVRCDGLEIGYPEKSVARDIHFEIERGERIAILGDNGQGKTTLMRTLAGDLAARDGLCEWAKNLRLGYYAQHVYAAIDGAFDVLTFLKKRAERHVSDQSILDMAGGFLFSGSDVEKPVSILSGGERARLCLMGLLLAKTPVLLLDEPTNHLDFETVEALGDALKRFDGSLFFISHDRTFVNEVATGILEVRDGAVKRYPGTYQEYVDRLSGDLGGVESRPWGEPNRAPGSAAPASSPDPSAMAWGGPRERRPAAPSAKKPSDYHARKKRLAQLDRLRKQLHLLESRMESCRLESETITRSFESEPTVGLRERSLRLDELHQALTRDEALWLELQQEMERLEGEGGS